MALVVLCTAACGRIAFDPTGLPTDGFVSLGLPTGGHASHVVIAPSNTDRIYIAFHHHGALRSDDGGKTFAPCGPLAVGGVEALEVSQLDDDLVFLGTTDDVYSSTDGCTTWTALGHSAGAISVAPLANGDVIVGSRNAIQRYRAGAFTQLRYVGGWVADLEVDATGMRMLAHTSAQTVIRSDDGGTTWSSVGTGLDPKDGGWDLVLRGGNFDQPMIVRDGVWLLEGTQWVQVSAALRYALAVDPNDEAYVLAGAFDGLRRSTNGAMSFSTGDLRDPSMDLSRISDLAFDPSTPGRVLAATGRGLFESKDRGTTGWTAIDTGAHAFTANDLDYDSATQRLYACTASGILISQDNGTSFRVSNTGLVHDSMCFGFARDANDPLRLLVAGREVAGSVDGATTFALEFDTEQADTFEARAVALSGARRFAGTRGRLLQSIDNAAWEGVALAGNPTARAVRFTRDGLGLALATDNGLFVRTDDAAPFMHFPALGDVSDVLETSTGTWIIVGVDGISVGHSPAGPYQQVASEPAHRVLETQLGLWIAGDAGVLRSRDGGASWERVAGWPLGVRAKSLAATDDVLFVGTAGHGIYGTRIAD